MRPLTVGVQLVHEGVLFTESKLTFINGTEGILTHLGIPLQEEWKLDGRAVGLKP